MTDSFLSRSHPILSGSGGSCLLSDFDSTAIHVCKNSAYPRKCRFLESLQLSIARSFDDECDFGLLFMRLVTVATVEEICLNHYEAIVT